ncbi:hypothetical protein C8R45DRAFT_813993, partial [Mycena sanguinolenta]
ENALLDPRRTLMAIADACEKRMVPLVLQDKDQPSGICMRVLDVRRSDDETPILIVVFKQDVKDALSSGSFGWISSYVSGSEGHNALLKVIATVQEQQLLLRLLTQNKKRFVSSYKPKRATTESSFTLSFLLPVGSVICRLKTTS